MTTTDIYYQFGMPVEEDGLCDECATDGVPVWSIPEDTELEFTNVCLGCLKKR